MKGLILLYRYQENVTIREYSKVEDYRDHYIVGKNWLGNREGILKKYVGEVCKTGFSIGETCNGSSVARYPVEVPYMPEIKWHNGYFVFVNKTRYDANPKYYYDMIKNYREE